MSFELLAPGGRFEMLRVAINSGADAVYIAGNKFGARANAKNFSKEDLREAIQFAHLRGKKIYVTVNTILFDDEMDDLLQTTDELVRLGVDALIAQDYGVLSILLHRYPRVAIHASTQMNVHSFSMAKKLTDMGVTRIILARETPLEVIKEIHQSLDVEIEVFVHGALCVSYSGNCYLSEIIGGRSGNRGECAQPCRLRYRLEKDQNTLFPEEHVLSMKDLMTLDEMTTLVEAGVSSFKIEGRMRSLEYALETVSIYREALDHLTQKPSHHEYQRLATVFNREFTKGYTLGDTPLQVTERSRPGHRGIKIGKVIQQIRGKTQILLEEELSVGDGIRVLSPTETGDKVSKIMKDGFAVMTAHPGDTITIDLRGEVFPDDEVWKTQDQAVKEEALHRDADSIKSAAIRVVASAKKNQLLWVKLFFGEIEGIAFSEELIQEAKSISTTKEAFETQLSKFGNTPYEVLSIQTELDEGLFLPNGMINAIRRAALDDLIHKLVTREAPVIVTSSKIPTIPSIFKQIPLVVSVETQAQYDACVSLGIQDIVIKSPLIMHASSDIIATRRIKLHGLDEIREARVMIQDFGDFESNLDKEIWTDLYLNVSNLSSVESMFQEGAKVVTLSMELTSARVAALADAFYERHHQVPSLCWPVYGRVDAMITRYCPIAVSEKVKKVPCRICDLHDYALKDPSGKTYPLRTDDQCIVRILADKPLSRIHEIPTLQKKGIIPMVLLTTEDETASLSLLTRVLQVSNHV
ncbi:MAG: U32 family peptidase [Candidatus Izemoplasmatales bacterium]|nr:U32 family peptidase [Candidatus Izemoplasmatales bacterium]